MKSQYWLKLSISKADDVRFLRCSPALLGRWTQLMLLAGKCEADGAFIQGDRQMTIDDIAVSVRADAKELEADLNTLKELNLVFMNGRGWQLSDFEMEQDGIRKYWREAKQVSRNVKDNSGNVHESLGSVRENVSSESESEQESESDKESDKESESDNRQEEQQRPDDIPAAAWKKITAGVDHNVDQAKTAARAYRILRAASLGDPKRLEASLLLATRTFKPDPITYLFGALAAVYHNQKITNRPVIAYKMILEGVPAEYLNPETWTKIPKQITLADGFTVSPLGDIEEVA